MFVILMGVSGSGKTTVGQALAQELGCPFFDGDDFHPAANIAKMAAGIPLNDEDRAGWLAALAALMRSGLEQNLCGVIACSALKEAYREVLQSAANALGQVRFVYLKGDTTTILARMQSRAGHYMKAAMLQSQFDTLEEPEGVITVDITQPPKDIVYTIMQRLEHTRYASSIPG
jgi:gluconokinase